MNSNKIDFTDYDRIQDVVIYLNDSLILSYIVRLSRKNNMNGQRSFFHYETEYVSDSYGSVLRSVKRTMNYYFMLHDPKVVGSGIILRQQDIPILLMYMDKVLPWYFGTPEQHAFQMVDGNMAIKEFAPVVYIQSEQNFIGFEPAICHYDKLDKVGEGVKITFPKGESYIITIDAFYGLYHLLKTSDMYGIACTNVVYAKVPPYGVNVFQQKGLGAMPPERSESRNGNFKGFGSNSFLDNSKKKGD